MVAIGQRTVVNAPRDMVRLGVMVIVDGQTPIVCPSKSYLRHKINLVNDGGWFE